jgi:hypothetical protein
MVSSMPDLAAIACSWPSIRASQVPPAFLTVESGHLLTAEDLPVVAGQVDAVSLANRLNEMKPLAAFVERVGAMPKQGVTSTFKFGQAS